MTNTPTNPTWDDLEEQVRQRTLEHYADEAALAQELLSHLVEQTRSLPEVGLTQAQGLVLLIVFSAIDSLKCALDLAFRGYYGQALSLIRNAHECWLAGAYVRYEPARAEQLSNKSSVWPKPSKMRGLVAKRVAASAKEAQLFREGFDRMYDRLSKLTHPSFDSVSGVVDDENSSHIGPFFQRNRLIICFDDAYRTVTLLHYLLKELFPSLQGPAWSQRTDALAQKVNAWRKHAIPEPGV